MQTKCKCDVNEHKDSSEDVTELQSSLLFVQNDFTGKQNYVTFSVQWQEEQKQLILKTTRFSEERDIDTEKLAQMFGTCCYSSFLSQMHRYIGFLCWFSWRFNVLT